MTATTPAVPTTVVASASAPAAPRLSRKARTGLTAVLALLGATLFGTPIAVVAFGAVAALWWGRPIAMAALFAAAVALATWVTTSGKPRPGPARFEPYVSAPAAPAAGTVPPRETRA